MINRHTNEHIDFKQLCQWHGIKDSVFNMAFELNMEVQEMPPDGSKCYQCEEPITGKMFQYFLFAGGDLEPTPTKYKVCETCYKKVINE